MGMGRVFLRILSQASQQDIIPVEAWIDAQKTQYRSFW